ncbi:MAG TPA: hypothetical protein PLU53_05540, partial [Bacteroidia bacterium]|nr:hypothetical protein [Bacteroidia bacterium]
SPFSLFLFLVLCFHFSAWVLVLCLLNDKCNAHALALIELKAKVMKHVFHNIHTLLTFAAL